MPPISSSPPDPVGFGSPRAAWIGGAREALGAPALVLGASYVGFGSLIRQLGLGLEIGLLSTLTAWAAPGQVAAIELHAAGASLASIFLAVALVNARLLPMAVTLTPVMRVAGRARWRIYLAAHLIAITAWAMTMLRAPSLPRGERLSFFVGFAVTLWIASLVGTAIGFAVTDDLPRAVSIALIFINPIYFLLLFFVPPRHRSRWLALAFGAALGPLFHKLSPGWGLLIAGLVAGSAAFVIDRLAGRHH